jgi:hypothetical protein
LKLCPGAPSPAAKKPELAGIWSHLRNVQGTHVQHLPCPVQKAPVQQPKIAHNPAPPPKRKKKKKGLFGKIASAFKKVGSAISKGVSSVAKTVANGVSSAVHAVGSVAGKVFHSVSSVASKIWDGVKSVGSAVARGVSSVASKVWDGAKSVGKAVGKAVEWAGNAVKDAVKWVAPRVGDAFRSLFTGALDTVTSAFRNVGEGIGTFAGGVGKLFSGKFLDGLKDMGLGVLKVFVQTPADALLLMGGRAVSAIQTMIGVEPVGRKLKDDEIAALRAVYGDSIDYSKVRIKEGDAGLFSTNDRPFTHGNTIYMKNNTITTDLLVHEMAHVWQHQNGGSDYMSEAIIGQNFGEGYDFEKGIKEGKSWSELNPEQQAELLQQAQSSSFFDSPNRRFVYNGTDYTDYLNDALRQVRAGQGAP